MERDTIGKISQDLLLKSGNNDHSAEEQMKEQLSEYVANIEEALADGKRLYVGDFYIVVITKRERLLTNVIRNYFFHRHSCPTPEWDQSVYRYSAADDELEFLWVVPSREICEEMRDHPLEVDTSERELLDFVLSYYDGSLFKMAKELNGEKVDSPLIES